MLRTALAPLRPALRPALARPPAAGVRLFQSSRPARSGLQNLFEVNADNPPLSVAKLDAKGFHLSDGLVVPGGVILADGAAFLWNVPPPGDIMRGMAHAWAGWTPERFALLERIVPRPEILIFGTGAAPLPVPREIRDYVSGLGITVDVMDSRNAASTYNLLFEEGRTVTAALCPLKPVDMRA